LSINPKVEDISIVCADRRDFTINLPQQQTGLFLTQLALCSLWVRSLRPLLLRTSPTGREPRDLDELMPGMDFVFLPDSVRTA
jgi:hypothetical protein